MSGAFVKCWCDGLERPRALSGVAAQVGKADGAEEGLEGAMLENEVGKGPQSAFRWLPIC
jgi:hypothetical protein